MRILHTITFFFCLVSGYLLFDLLLNDTSNSDKLIGVAIASAFVITSHCLVRALDGMSNNRDRELLSVMKRTNELMEMAVKMGNEPQPPQPAKAKTPHHFSLTDN